MTAKWDFDPLEKDQIGKLKTQKCKSASFSNCEIKLWNDLWADELHSHLRASGVKSVSASHREKYSQILTQTFSKISRFCPLKWAPEHVKLKYFLQGYCQFLQKSFYSVSQGAHKRIFHAHFIERFSQKFDNILPDSMGQSSRQAHKNVLGRNIIKIGERRLRIFIHFLSKILIFWG